MSVSAAKVAKAIGKFFLKTLVYTFNVIMTVILICFIAGIITGSAFLWYVNNYIETEIDETIFDQLSCHSKSHYT